MNVGLLALLVPLAAGNPGAVHGLPGLGIPGPNAAPVSGPVPPFPQFGGPPPRPPMAAPAPVLAAKVLAPEGVRVTVHPGTPLARMLATPTPLAFRPGYVYRLELSNLPYHPGKAVYPTVEVRGTLVPRPSFKYMDYPIPVFVTSADIERAMNGGVVTKVIYLEDPEKALPQTIKPDEPVELLAGTEEEAVKEATANGRLVAILRMGGKVPDPEELAMTAVDGTVLFPGEQYLRTPTRALSLPWLAVPLFDPILGPKPATEECFVDGCDKGGPLGIGPYGKVGGLNPTDVAFEYTVGGRGKVTTSNQVCLCVPRFLIQRVDRLRVAANQAIQLSVESQVTARVEFRERIAAMAEVGREKVVEVDGSKRPQVQQTRLAPGVVSWFTQPVVAYKVDGVAQKAAVVEPEEITNANCLVVTKCVDPQAGVQVGDVVTFTIKYANQSGKPITDVVLSDSLSGRLEYVPGTGASDRPNNFAVVPNEAGSAVLRWEFPGTLLPGQAGTVKFQAKVR